MRLNFTFGGFRPGCNESASYRDLCISNVANHEFAHALALAHESNRPDDPGYCGNGGANGDTTVGAYDIESITNYCNPEWDNGSVLSMGDIGGLHYLYAPNPPRGKSVYYRNSANQIVELWWADSSGWSSGNLTTATSAPSAAGEPEALYHKLQQNIFYRDTSDHIQQLWNFSGGGWYKYDITSGVAGPAAAGKPVALGLGNMTHVFFVSSSSQIEQYWHDGSTWRMANISSLAGAPLASPTNIAAYSLGNRVRVVYRGTDSYTHVLSWDSQNGWAHSSIAPGVAIDGGVYGIAVGFREYIFLRQATSGHIWMLSRDFATSTTWDLTVLTDAVPGAVFAGSDPVVTARSKYLNVYYRGADNHIHELFYDYHNGGSWVHNDLTATTGAPGTSFRPTALVHASNQNVFFRSATTNDLHELFWTPTGGWGSYSTGAPFPDVAGVEIAAASHW